MLRDFGDLLDHSWYHSPDMRSSSIADSLRDPIIQPRVRSLKRTLASQVVKSYLPLKRGGTGNDLDSHVMLRGPFHPTSQPVDFEEMAASSAWVLCLSTKRRQKLAYNQCPKIRQWSRPNSTPPVSITI
jgi:hypothetical protein